MATIVQSPDFSAIKTRQQHMWSSGDYNVVGVRILLMSELLCEAVDVRAGQTVLDVATGSGNAASAAFEPETLAILDARREEFRTRRDFLVPALRNVGFDIPQSPHGAFYVYAGCAGLTQDSFGFAFDLLEHAGVAITPGADFGAHRAREHVRFAYTSSIERLREGVSRIERFVAGERFFSTGAAHGSGSPQQGDEK